MSTAWNREPFPLRPRCPLPDGGYASDESWYLSTFGSLLRRRGALVGLNSSQIALLDDEAVRNGTVPLRDMKEIEVSADGTVAMIVSRDPYPKLHRVDLDTWTTTEVKGAMLHGHKSWIARWDGGVVVSGTFSSFVTIHPWTGETRDSLYIDHPEGEYFGLEALAVSLDGRTVALADSGASEEVGMCDEPRSDPQLRVYDVPSRSCIASVERSSDRVVVSADGAYVLFPHGVFRRDDLSRAHAPAPAFRLGAALPGSSHVVLLDWERVTIFDCASGKEVALVEAWSNDANRLEVDPDGWISARARNEWRLWSPAR